VWTKKTKARLRHRDKHSSNSIRNSNKQHFTGTTNKLLNLIVCNWFLMFLIFRQDIINVKKVCAPKPLTNWLRLCSNSKEKKIQCNRKNNLNLYAAPRCMRFPLYDGVLAALNVHVLHVISGVYWRVRLWFHDFRHCPQWGVLGGMVLPGGMLWLGIKN